jgi:hypothetical protein
MNERHPGYEFTLRRVARCRQPSDALWMTNLALPELLGIA